MLGAPLDEYGKVCNTEYIVTMHISLSQLFTFVDLFNVEARTSKLLTHSLTPFSHGSGQKLYNVSPATILTYSFRLVHFHTSNHTRTPVASTTHLTFPTFLTKLHTKLMNGNDRDGAMCIVTA